MVERRLAALVCACLISLAQAQQALQADDVRGALEASAREILLYVPAFSNRAQADAIRKVLVERGVRVAILTPPGWASQGASFVASLALAGAHVFEARVPDAPHGVLVVDGQTVIAGPLVGASPGLRTIGTRLETSDKARDLDAWLRGSLSRARPVTLAEVVRVFLASK